MSDRARPAPTARADTRGGPRGGAVARVGVALAAGLVVTACATTPEEEPLDPSAYVDTMNGLCTTTADRIAALPAPPEAISEADWAAEVSRLLRDEATAADAVTPPDESAADHRALVANTEDQSAAWQQVADSLTAGGDLADLTTEIGELTLGREDLVTEMGLDGCRRDL